MAVRSANINVMIKAAEKAARGLRRDFGEVENLQISRKGPGDFVSRADKQAERVIQDELNKARPEFGFLMEESGAVDGSDGEHTWIIDPLDGTTNFLHAIPHFCISIGLQKGEEIVAGVVYQPLTNELFWAERGVGAFDHNQRLRVSGRRTLEDSVVGTGVPRLGCPGYEPFCKQLVLIMGQVGGIRRMGAAALDLCYVAAGRFDAYWEMDLKPWDVAAGIVIVQEAGGFITDLKGRRNPLSGESILAGNAHIHGALGKCISGQAP
jgi:myo-inositol-1(or 4)-monophosphatase